MKLLVAFLWVGLSAQGLLADPKVHVFSEADNTLCRTDTLKMNENLVRVLGFFGISTVDMLTQMDYRSAPSVRTCFRHLIKRELQKVVPSVTFRSVYTPHDAAMAQKSSEWSMGSMYETYIEPIELSFLKLLKTREFTFPYALDESAMVLRTNLYQKYRNIEPPPQWSLSAQNYHRDLNILLRNTENFYQTHRDVDWDRATKGQTLTFVMNKEFASDPSVNHVIIFIDYSPQKRDEVAHSLEKLNVPFLVTAPPHMRGVFTEKPIYIPIGMFTYQLAVTLKRLPFFSHDDFLLILDLVEQDIEQKHYKAAIFLLGLLHRALPHFSSEIEDKIRGVLQVSSDALSIFQEEDFRNIDFQIEYRPEYASAHDHWEYLENLFEGEMTPNLIHVAESVVSSETKQGKKKKSHTVRRFLKGLF